jgi:hypothetical protein
METLLEVVPEISSPGTKASVTVTGLANWLPSGPKR